MSLTPIPCPHPMILCHCLFSSSPATFSLHPKFFSFWYLSPLSAPSSPSSSLNPAKTPFPPGRLPAFKTHIEDLLLTPAGKANPSLCSFPETRFLLPAPPLCLQGAHKPVIQAVTIALEAAAEGAQRWMQLVLLGLAKVLEKVS